MEKTVRMLQFDKIKQRLQGYTLTPAGAERAASLQLLTVPGQVRVLQRQTAEAVAVIRQGLARMERCEEIRPYLKRAERGGLLGPDELFKIMTLLKGIKALKNSFLGDSSLAERFPLITELVSRMEVFTGILSELERCLTGRGEISDSASSYLLSLRKEEKRVQEKIRSTLDSYLRNPQYQKFLQENIVTLRQDRYVLPVKQEFRHHIPGVVHDQSSSGLTLYIEPLPALELNNRLREIRAREEEEIEKILRKLTALVGSRSSEITESFVLYGEVDFILARGHLAVSYEGREPFINEGGYIDIKAGRHPLLPPDEVVPTDIHLGREFDILVITGPNTGGKTVALKTVGLFVLMSQSGLHVPAGAGTDLGVFETVWADIGDEQDIEQSLSTFSGHMVNIIEILKRADSSSLVLLDELGAGTDPSEGAALAMAILDDLYRRGIKTIATTHINEIKVFAHQREGMENASMEFDASTLSPTFRLLIGVPGQSNALTIAEGLGLSAELTGRARSFMRREFLDLEEVVSDLVEERRKLLRDSGEMEAMKQEVGFHLRELEEEKEKIKQKKKEILRKAREEASSLVRSAKKKTDQIVKKMHSAEREKPASQAFAIAEHSRKELKELGKEYEVEEDWQDHLKEVGLQEIAEGDVVFIRSLRCRGEVIAVLSEKEIHVRAGSLKVNTELSDLGIPAGDRPQRAGPGCFKQDVSAKSSDLLGEKSELIRPTLDVRGLNLEEAAMKVEKYLDDSLLAGLEKVEIIHGKGTGRLRQGLHRYLAAKGDIESYRLGSENEGGSGVTIVYFKKG